MRALILAVVLVASVASATTVRVSTFNVLCQACALTDDDYKYWEERLVAFEDLLARQACDIYGIQELMHRGNVQQMLDILPPSFKAIFFNESNIPAMYPDAAIFYDSNVVTPEDSGQYWLSRHPDRPFSIGWELSLPRIVDWAVFRHRTSGASFLFVSTHFDNNGKNKIPSANLFLERTAPFDAQGLPVIAVGDFNSPLQSDSYAVLTEQGLNGFRFVNSLDLATDPRYEGPSEPVGYGCPMTVPDADYPNCLIDHIFVGVGNSPVSRYNVTEWVVDTYMYDGKFPSDHRLHAATISFD